MPPLTGSVCNVSYDHYCPFLGNAIGKGNYRFYLAFIASTSLLTVRRSFKGFALTATAATAT